MTSDWEEPALNGTRMLARSALAALVALCSLATAARSQGFPSRLVTIVTPFGAGSATDTVARILAARMSEDLGRQLIVENIGGAGGMLGVSRVAKAAPDGYTVVLGAADSFAQSQTLYKKPLYNSIADFDPVALAVEQPLLLIIRKELPPNDLKEFVVHVKANNSRMQYGSAGVGSAPHLVCSQITTAIGAPVPHVPYRSSAPALQDLIAGTLDFYCPLAAAAAPLIDAKTVKAVAMLTKERSQLFPNLATAAEQGLAGIDGYYWMGIFAPKGTPADAIARLNRAVSATLDTPAVQARLRDVGTTVVARERRTPAYLAQFLDSEIKTWADTINKSGVKLD